MTVWNTTVAVFKSTVLHVSTLGQRVPIHFAWDQKVSLSGNNLVASTLPEMKSEFSGCKQESFKEAGWKAAGHCTRS